MTFSSHLGKGIANKDLLKETERKSSKANESDFKNIVTTLQEQMAIRKEHLKKLLSKSGIETQSSSGQYFLHTFSTL